MPDISLTHAVSRRKAIRNIGAGAAALAAMQFSGCGRFRAINTSGRPNILFAIADDWSWPHAGPYNEENVSLPTYDLLRSEGMTFRNAFVSVSSCTPSRASILTGRNFWELEAGANLWGTLPARFDVYPDLLEKSGYHTGFVNKGWGPGRIKPGGRDRNPAGKRFDTFEHFLMERPSGAPFCFWFGSRNPHRYYGLKARLSRVVKANDLRVPPFLPDLRIVRNDLSNYLVEVHRFDREVSRLIRLLRRRGELDNTIVVMTSDNGMPFPRSKATCYDPGTNVPLVIRWPGHVPAGTECSEFVNLIDLAPTFLDAAQTDVPQSMSGNSIIHLLNNNNDSHHRRDYVLVGRERHHAAQGDPFLGYPSRAIRTENYLYIYNFLPERWPAGKPPHYGDTDNSPTKRFIIRNRHSPEFRKYYDLAFGKRPADELYDLRADPHQLNNIASRQEYAAVCKELKTKLMDELKRTGDPRALGKGNVFDQYDFYTLKRMHQ